MADLRSLRESILTMPASEVLEIHRSIRESRTVAKKPKTKAAADRRGIRRSIFSAIESMSDLELDELIKSLERR